MRITRILGPGVLVAVALVTMILALAYGGGAAPQALEDPGPVVRWALPTATLFVNVSAAGMIGALILACWALSPREKEWAVAIDVAAASAGVFTVAAAATGFLTFLQVTNTPLALNDSFGATLSQFLTSISLGQAWLGTTLIGAAVTIIAFAVRNQTLLVFVAALAVASLVPMAQQGHAAGTSGHNAAVVALGFHLIFAAIWLGGLLTLILLRRSLPTGRLIAVLGRYSTLALVAFIVVAISGYVSAALRVGTWGNLLTAYGVLVVGKVAALIALGFFGALQRRYAIARIERAQNESRSDRGWFWGLVTVEIAFMGVASGLAVALAKTATPIAQTIPTAQTPAEVLTGEPLPPVFTPVRVFTAWNFDLFWVLACGFAVFFYVAGVVRLRLRGERWPALRTASWIAGVAVLFYATNGAVEVYGQYLFGAQLVAFLLVGIGVGALIVPGAPISLATRAMAARHDGSRGGLEWMLIVVYSKPARFFASPIVASVLFLGSIWIVTFTPIMRWATTDRLGHEVVLSALLIIAWLFVQSLIGIDPVPYRLPHLLRILVLGLAAVSVAAFGLFLDRSNALLLADWYGAMGWGSDAIAAQQAVGTLVFIVAGAPILALAIAVSVQWARSRGGSSPVRSESALSAAGY